MISRKDLRAMTDRVYVDVQDRGEVRPLTVAPLMDAAEDLWWEATGCRLLSLVLLAALAASVFWRGA